jgi:hypothetical protein
MEEGAGQREQPVQRSCGGNMSPEMGICLGQVDGNEAGKRKGSPKS